MLLVGQYYRTSLTYVYPSICKGFRCVFVELFKKNEIKQNKSFYPIENKYAAHVWECEDCVGSFCAFVGLSLVSHHLVQFSIKILFRFMLGENIQS